MAFNIEKIRKDFPAIKQRINGKPVIYLDNACMTLKPTQVIKSMEEYYYKYPGCHGRANHYFGRKTTEEYKKARNKTREFIHAKYPEEIIFIRNTTEGINFIANSFSLNKGDVVLTTDMEHNSNLLPWQYMSRKKMVTLKIISHNNDLTFNMEGFEKAMNEKVRLVSIAQTSNVTGVTVPIGEIIKIAHKYGALVLIDAAQTVAHQAIDVQKMDVDFLVFSFHKMLGPTGMGVLYGKRSLLEELPQFLIGGETVIDSSYDSFIPAELPNRFEAGLQNYAGAIGSAAAIEYIKKIGMKNIINHEHKLNTLITERITDFSDIKLLGPTDPSLRGNIVNFNIKGMNMPEVADLMDATSNIMVRAGMYCTHSWFNAHNIPQSMRISLYFYNTEEEVSIFLKTLEKIIKYFK